MNKLKPRISSILVITLLTSYSVGADICEGLVGYWPLDGSEGRNALDLSGYDNDGAIKGATWVEGRLGSALQFNGQGDHILIKDYPKPQKQLTISAWVYANNVQSPFKQIAANWGMTDKGQFHFGLSRDG